MFLLLDIKKLIASYNPDAWYMLWKIDPEFHEYARSHAGRLDYVRKFEICGETKNSKTWKLFGKFHRLFDLPAIIKVDGSKEWYVNDEFHRENDLPAMRRWITVLVS